MAYQDQFYTVGTVTVTNGSTAVTGAGTGWETALIVGGVLYAGGGAYPIQSVSSETELTLAIPYIGDDAAGLNYAIDRQRAAAISNIAMNDRLAQIIREISIGNIEELNALELVANKVLTTNAAGHLSQEALGTLGRAVLALAAGTNAQYVQGDGTLQTLNAAAVGLGNVNNTSDANKPISTATQTALNGKFDKTGGALTGGINISSNPDSAVRFFNSTSYGYTVFFNSGNGTTDNGLQVVHSNSGLVATFLYNGNFSIPGTIAKGGGTFLIDHPLDPLNRNLRHGFVEAPRYDLIYRGTVRLVDGRVTVDIDAASKMSAGTFAALTTNAVVTSLQNQDGFARLKSGPINGGSFEIICEDENCTDLVSWVVIAERNDPFVKSDLDQNTDSEGRFVPEFEKED
ncbi:hypothetical protein [Brucella anthropi]|uniref:hypothetical protein n=1 Tax=Brucella anthropi TaxID=529 RepID=UPI00124E1ABF|nr:hypothetical protein [Brucella anthropi]KAB2724130.1 hypothetical protein F9K76_20190 [Brucella anthropi]KAB2739663.1 hypothetical protein F9K74_18345 [Brucella anthropi]KAB2802022.1 hypothetical protein F9K83_18340 [Brucella anthropi]